MCSTGGAAGLSRRRPGRPRLAAACHSGHPQLLEADNFIVWFKPQTANLPLPSPAARCVHDTQNSSAAFGKGHIHTCSLSCVHALWEEGGGHRRMVRLRPAMPSCT